VAVNGAEAQQALLAREKEWREAQAAWEKVEAAVAAAETAVTHQRREIDEKQTAVDGQRQEEERLARLAGEAAQRVSRARQKRERAKQQRRFLQRQEAELDKRVQARREERERLAERIAAAEKRIEELRQEIVDGETAVAEARTQLDQLPVAEAKQQRQSLNQAINSAQTIVAGRQAVVDSRRAALNQVDKQIARLEEREASLRRQQEQLAISEEEATRRRLQSKLDELEAQLRPVRAQLATNRRDLRRLEDDMAAIQRRTLELETQYTQAQVRLSQRENQIEGLQERIKADLGIVALSYDDDQTGPTPLPISNFVEQLPTVEELPEDIEENIHNYRGQLQRMGGINPDAPQEYEQTQERFDFLSQQVEDLNQTEAQLRDVIEELDDLTSRAFAQTVEDVNEVFGDTFHQLFEGGSARLALTDPDDLTVSGVDIIAKLPNRREQGLGLLSGGERSLTAAALIFSLLKVSPTPFCVMDEVDAALDEANVNRFRELLRELSLKIQFVVITHNRGTVQAADTIYGISMNADSTSQSISIKPDEYLKQEELF
jgi:chromosome segregation protein